MIDEIIIYRADETEYWLCKDDLPTRRSVENLSTHREHVAPGQDGFYGFPLALLVGEIACFEITEESENSIRVDIGENCEAGRAEFLEMEEVSCSATYEYECDQCGSTVTNDDPDHSDCGYGCNGEVGYEDEIPDSLWLRKTSRTYQLGTGDEFMTDEMWQKIVESERELRSRPLFEL